mmetsp:Transcript_43941/g.139985  ORF Transcript_43941/g.139985 Transcript_43941/m.139985 type:complete len:200 (+) Transcript_43941:455-1054(+)
MLFCAFGARFERFTLVQAVAGDPADPGCWFSFPACASNVFSSQESCLCTTASMLPLSTVPAMTMSAMPDGSVMVVSCCSSSPSSLPPDGSATAVSPSFCPLSSRAPCSHGPRPAPSSGAGEAAEQATGCSATHWLGRLRAVRRRCTAVHPSASAGPAECCTLHWSRDPGGGTVTTAPAAARGDIGPEEGGGGEDDGLQR